MKSPYDSPVELVIACAEVLRQEHKPDRELVDDIKAAIRDAAEHNDRYDGPHPLTHEVQARLCALDFDAETKVPNA